MAGILAKIFGGGGAKTVLDGANEILGTIDGLHTSASEKAEMRSQVIGKLVDAQAAVLVAEANRGGLTANWRPITMLTFVGLIVAHYFLFPMIVAAFPVTAPVLLAASLPGDLWFLIQVGLGGYIGGRSVEKLTGMAVPLMTARQEMKKLKLEAKLGSQ